MELRVAKKESVFLKIGISGPSGFGKTYSALLLAYGITGDWSKIAVIDTENNSASLYSDLGEYLTLNLTPPYSPERYNEAIGICERSGIECCVIDSISHEWEGKGGCLEAHEQLGGQFAHWAKITPRHRSFIDTILQCKMHTITTVRKKQDYDLVKNDKGKMEPVKVGLKEITREGFEYELTLNLEIINANHLVKASKDRTNLFDGAPEFIITSETGKDLIKWAKDGEDYELNLSQITDIEELKNYYKSLSVANQHKYSSLVTELKDKLTPKT